VGQQLRQVDRHLPDLGLLQQVKGIEDGGGIGIAQDALDFGRVHRVQDKLILRPEQPLAQRLLHLPRVFAPHPHRQSQPESQNRQQDEG